METMRLTSMQKKHGADINHHQSHQVKPKQQVLDLTDFMNDMFFGSVKDANDHKNAYNLTGTGVVLMDDDDRDVQENEINSSRNSTRLSHQEWLEEARRMVASSPARCDSPSRLVGSPRFAVAQGAQSPSLLDRRGPLSRSARRSRAVESISGEILTKSTKHSRTKSETPQVPTSPSDSSPASAVHNWFSNILSPSTATLDSPPPSFHARQSLPRKSRFQNDPSSPRPQGIPVPSRRSIHTTTPLTDTQLLSPPKNLVESAHRRSISSSTCSVDKIAPKPISHELPTKPEAARDLSLNGFLREQSIKLGKILDDEIDSKAKIVLSGPSNSTSSMVAAICYAWLLENRMRRGSCKGKGDNREAYAVVPVMNVKRERMWKQKQAAWLFYHVGLEVNSLLFADEVDMENLMVAGKLNILVVGDDVLRTNGEDGTQCTILTDNYCEDAYDLLQTPVVKKLLLAAILLDTHNLNASSQVSMTRDAEAVQLLLVGATPNYRNSLFDQLTQGQRDNSFLEAMQHNYGKSPNEIGHENGEHVEHGVLEKKSTSTSQQSSDKKSNDSRNAKNKKVSPQAVKQSSSTPKAPEPSRGKNKFFLAKWFGF